MLQFLIYTDGGCRNTGNYRHGHVKNNDKSAYAYLLVNPETHHKVSGTKGYYGKTNNQMEVQGVIAGLTYLVKHHSKSFLKHDFLVVSDSKYVDNAFNLHWIHGWKNRNFKNVKNANEWKSLIRLTTFFPNLKFKWVKGHAHTKGNIFVDHLLNKTMDNLK